MAVDFSDPVTLVVFIGLVGFAVFWWLRWRWRMAWFDRMIADARRRALEDQRTDDEEDG